MHADMHHLLKQKSLNSTGHNMVEKMVSLFKNILLLYDNIFLIGAVIGISFNNFTINNRSDLLIKLINLIPEQIQIAKAAYFLHLAKITSQPNLFQALPVPLLIQIAVGTVDSEKASELEAVKLVARQLMFSPLNENVEFHPRGAVHHAVTSVTNR
jgi:hypothetical protein